jgi:RimJ/RimL family protein N-acetyltransferase
MNGNFLRGKQVILRPLEERDITLRYCGWLNDEEVCRYNSHAIFPNNESRVRDYVRWSQETRDAVVLAIVWAEDGVHIGNIALLDLDWISRSASFAILIGEKDYWHRGGGADAGSVFVQYAFERLNLNRVYCGTAEDNFGMQGLAGRLGMKLEGRRRQAAYKLGRFVDILEYGVLREEFMARAAVHGSE